MRIFEAGKHNGDELSDTASLDSLGRAELDHLLADTSERPFAEQAETEYSEVSTSGDHNTEAWYEQPKQECLRYRK